LCARSHPVSLPHQPRTTPCCLQDDVFASALALSGAATGARLAVLDLSDNAVACAGAAALAAALEGAGARCSLRQLDLGFNSIGDGGACALAGALAATGIMSLELEGNQVRARALRLPAGRPIAVTPGAGRTIEAGPGPGRRRPARVPLLRE
jgi:hypothetical protein